MPVEVVRVVDVSPRQLIDHCRTVGGERDWKILDDGPGVGGLIFKTPVSWMNWWGYYINVSLQRFGDSTLMTVSAELGGAQIFDPTREGTRLARDFVRDVLHRIESDSSSG